MFYQPLHLYGANHNPIGVTSNEDYSSQSNSVRRTGSSSERDPQTIHGEGTGTTRSRNDLTENSLTFSVLQKVSRTTGRPLEELDPPMYDIVDPDALEALFDGHEGRFDGFLTFEAYGCTITIHSTGQVSVNQIE